MMSSISLRKRNKVFRIITSSLLSSELTSLDLHHVADALGKDIDFQREVAFKLHEATSLFDPRSRPHFRHSTDEEDFADDADLVSTGLRLVKHRRLSKSEILKRLGSVSPEAAKFFERGNATVREILSGFAQREPEKKMRAFVAALAGPGAPDEYLKGILRQ
jgi:hypothetical protein